MPPPHTHHALRPQFHSSTVLGEDRISVMYSESFQDKMHRRCLHAEGLIISLLLGYIREHIKSLQMQENALVSWPTLLLDSGRPQASVR